MREKRVETKRGVKDGGGEAKKRAKYRLRRISAAESFLSGKFKRRSGFVRAAGLGPPDPAGLTEI